MHGQRPRVGGSLSPEPAMLPFPILARAVLSLDISVARIRSTVFVLPLPGVDSKFRAHASEVGADERPYTVYYLRSLLMQPRRMHLHKLTRLL
jgi:hypothetical protein